jgi:fatty acid kinase fatty acid binding subunit
VSRARGGCVAVVTDSTGDVPPDEAAALGLTVVPALLTVEGRTYVDDGRAFSRADLYRRMSSLEGLPTTAVPSPERFAAVYESLLRAGAPHILSIHLAGRLSGMFQTAAQAAQDFGDRVRVFDSGQVSLGLGFQAMEAAAAALAGNSIQLVTEVARQARDRARLIAMLNTLEFVRRSGRVGWLRASLGGMLNIKQLVEVVDGTIHRLERVRTRSRALDSLRQMAANWGPLRRLAILHTAVPEEASALRDEMMTLSKHNPLVVEVTTIIGAHVGPGSIGMAALLA